MQARNTKTQHTASESPHLQSLGAEKSLGRDGVRLVVKGETSEKAPKTDAHTYPDTHGCIPKEGTRGVCDELLKSDSRPLIRTYQAISLTHRPDDPKAGPPRRLEWGGKPRYR